MFQNSALPTTADLPKGLPHAGLVHTLRRTIGDVPLPQSAREFLVWVLLMAFVTGLIAVQIWVSMKVSEAENTVLALNDAYILIEQENAELLWQISQFTNLDRIELEAARVGYAPALQREYRWVEPGLLNTIPAAASAGQAPAVDSLPAAASAEEMAGAESVATPAEQPPWYQVYWQEFRAWWQPQESAIGAMWQP